MKENYYVYNNEAIASCVFLSILDKVQSIDIVKACLFLPILLDDRVVASLVKTDNDDLELFIKEQPRLFFKFSKRFNALLPVVINSLFLLKQYDYLYIKERKVFANKKINTNKIEGKRFENIELVIPKILAMLEKHSIEQLYFIFKVQL